MYRGVLWESEQNRFLFRLVYEIYRLTAINLKWKKQISRDYKLFLHVNVHKNIQKIIATIIIIIIIIMIIIHVTIYGNFPFWWRFQRVLTWNKNTIQDHNKQRTFLTLYQTTKFYTCLYGYVPSHSCDVAIIRTEQQVYDILGLGFHRSTTWIYFLLSVF